MQFDAVAGAHLCETWSEDGVERFALGTVVSASPPWELRFEWTEPNWPAGSSQVAITIHDDGTGTIVTVEENGLHAASGDADLLAAHRDGWAEHLARLVDAAHRLHASQTEGNAGQSGSTARRGTVRA